MLHRITLRHHGDVVTNDNDFLEPTMTRWDASCICCSHILTASIVSVCRCRLWTAVSPMMLNHPLFIWTIYTPILYCPGMSSELMQLSWDKEVAREAVLTCLLWISMSVFQNLMLSLIRCWYSLLPIDPVCIYLPSGGFGCLRVCK